MLGKIDLSWKDLKKISLRVSFNYIVKNLVQQIQQRISVFNINLAGVYMWEQCEPKEGDRVYLMPLADMNRCKLFLIYKTLNINLIQHLSNFLIKTIAMYRNWITFLER